MDIILIILLIALYFLPTIIAYRRDNNFISIFLLNLFLGWTILGWLIALIWSTKDMPKKNKFDL